MNERNSAPRVAYDWKLIRRYVDQGSQAAFAELVTKYLNFVNSVCRRETGDCDVAQDAAQAVFLVMAARATAFRPGIVLSTWLFETSRLTCKNAQRVRRRQQAREEKVVAKMAQMQTPESAGWKETVDGLNDALGSLSEADRRAILLRFFEGCSLAEVGAELGLSEDAARMRVSRAIERMRKYFVRNQTAIATMELANILTSEAVSRAPAALSRAIVSWTPGGAIVREKVHHRQNVAVGTSESENVRAHRLIAQAAQAYANLKTYSDTEVGSGDGGLGMPYTADFTYKRSNHALLVVTSHGKTRRLQADANYIYDEALDGSHSYTRMPLHSGVPTAFAMATQADIKFPMAAVFLEQSAMVMTGLKNVRLAFGPPEVIDGVKTDAVVETSDPNSAGTYYVGRRDHLLRQVAFTTPPDPLRLQIIA